MITTNEGFWDCDCKGLPEDYIQSKKLRKCLRCNAVPDDQPDAHESELNDRVIHVANSRAGIDDETRCSLCSRKFADGERPSVIQTSIGVHPVCENDVVCEEGQIRNELSSNLKAVG